MTSSPAKPVAKKEKKEKKEKSEKVVGDVDEQSVTETKEERRARKEAKRAVSIAGHNVAKTILTSRPRQLRKPQLVITNLDHQAGLRLPLPSLRSRWITHWEDSRRRR